MPTCWDGKSIGDNNDHKSHMRYTTNGKINGPCPAEFGHRLPQITLTVWSTEEYNGGIYQLSDGSDIFHVDFYNGWKEGKLLEILDECPPSGSADDGFNPPCACKKLLTCNEAASGTVCDADVRKLFVDEATHDIVELPRGSCRGPKLLSKSWTALHDDLFGCDIERGFECESEEPAVCGSIGTYPYLQKQFSVGRANGAEEKFATFWTIARNKRKVLGTECRASICAEADCCTRGPRRTCTNTGNRGLKKRGFTQRMCGNGWKLLPKERRKQRACTNKGGASCRVKDCCKKRRKLV